MHTNTFVLSQSRDAREFASVKEAFETKKPSDSVWIKARGPEGTVTYYGPARQP